MENNIAQLKGSGLKVTGPRLKILDLFETHAEEHLSAEDVYRILLEEGVEIGVATIYRVLTQFEQADILLRHHFESGKAVYELNKGDHHDHIVCVKCGKVTEFHNPTIESKAKLPKITATASWITRCICMACAAIVSRNTIYKQAAFSGSLTAPKGGLYGSKYSFAAGRLFAVPRPASGHCRTRRPGGGEQGFDGTSAFGSLSTGRLPVV